MATEGQQLTVAKTDLNTRSPDLFAELSSSSNQSSLGNSKEIGRTEEYSDGAYNSNSSHGYRQNPMGLNNGYTSPVMQSSQMLMQTINAPVFFMGRMSQLLGMSFQSLHMSFASFIRLASMFLMLKGEVSTALKFIYEFILRRLQRIFASREQNLYADAWDASRPKTKNSHWILSFLALGATFFILKSLYNYFFNAKSQKKKVEEAIAALSKDKDLVRALTHNEVLHMVNEVLHRRKPQSSNEFAVDLLQKCTKSLQKLARSPQLLQALRTPAVRKALSDIGAGRKTNMSYRIQTWIIQCAELKEDNKEPEKSNLSGSSANMGMMSSYGAGGMGMMGMGYGGYGMGSCYGGGYGGMGLGYGGYGGYGGGYGGYY